MGGFDVLVNKVGLSQKGRPMVIWDEPMEVNLKSVCFYCRFVLPIVERQGSGVVVDVSSIAGMRYIGKPQVCDGKGGGYTVCKSYSGHVCR